MMDVGGRAILAAVEDLATVTTVAVETARVAMEQHATDVVLLHVLDQHTVMGAVFGMSGYCAPVQETMEEGEALLTLAEQAMRAEFEACQRPTPAIRHEVAEGDVASAIQLVAEEQQVETIVLGARRPRAFGRLVHPDVRSHIVEHGARRVHVASLQEAPPAARA